MAVTPKLEARIAISRLDFNDALWSIVTALTHPLIPGLSDARIRYALVSYAIIAYSRPFIGSRGAGVKKLLDVHDLPALRHSPEDTKFHNYVIKTLRNQVIAHSDNTLRKVRRVEGKGWGGAPWHTYKQVDVMRLVREVDQVGIANLCGKALMACNDLVFEPSRPDSAAQLLAPRSIDELPGWPGDVSSRQ